MPGETRLLILTTGRIILSVSDEGIRGLEKKPKGVRGDTIGRGTGPAGVCGPASGNSAGGWE